MKKITIILTVFLCCILMFSGLSCSGGRENEAPPEQGTSQVKLTVATDGEEPFLTDQGYAIRLESGSLRIIDIKISGEAGGGDEHNHTHGASSAPGDNIGIRHADEGGGGSGEGLHLEGPFNLNLLERTVNLGFFNGNPGDYSVFSFLIHPPTTDEEEEEQDEEHHHATPSVTLIGSAEKDGVTYPFHVELPVEHPVSLENLDIPMHFGSYIRIVLHFETGHWLNGVDFSTAEQEEGEIHITTDENPELAAIIQANIVEHVEVTLPDNE